MDDLNMERVRNQGENGEGSVSGASGDPFLDELMSDDDFDLTSLDVDVSNLSVGDVTHSVELVEGSPLAELEDDDALPELDEIEGFGKFDEVSVGGGYSGGDDGYSEDLNGDGGSSDGGWASAGGDHQVPSTYVDGDDGGDVEYSYGDSDSDSSYDDPVSDFSSVSEVVESFDEVDDSEIGVDEASLFDDVDSVVSSFEVSSSLSNDDVVSGDDGVDDSLEGILAGAFDDEDDYDHGGASVAGSRSRFDWDYSGDDDEDSNDPFLNFDVDRVLSLAIKRNASDVHISANDYAAFTVLGDLKRVEEFGIFPANAVQRIYVDITSNVAQSDFSKDLDLDTSYMIRSGEFKGSLMRLNVAKSFNAFSLVFRVISNEIPSPASLGISDVMLDWCDLRNGLIMVNGATGSGKSTTIASMVRQIQINRPVKIVSIELPIEYMFGTVGKAFVTQREVGRDARSFAGALTSAMRQAPDVILLGEVRNQVEVNELLRAAETGHLAISTMHTNSAAATLNRIRSLYEGDDQVRILGSLAENARGFVNQALLKSPDGDKRFAVREILEVDDEVSRMIQRGDVEGIKNYQYDREATMEHELVKVVVAGLATLKEARGYATNRGRFDALMKAAG